MNLPLMVMANREKVKVLSSMYFCVGCYQKVPTKFRVGLSASNILMKKILHRSAPAVCILVDDRLIKLTATISHYII